MLYCIGNLKNAAVGVVRGESKLISISLHHSIVYACHSNLCYFFLLLDCFRWGDHIHVSPFVLKFTSSVIGR